MASKWLLEWDIEQETPTMEHVQSGEMISFAHFPENEQSFVFFEGVLFDRHNFRADKNASDATRVIEYYNIFGEELFSKLHGAYSLIIWDAERRCLIVGRDHIGQIPFSYFWDHKKFLVSSSMRMLLKRPEITNELNRFIIAEHLLFFWSDHQLTETYFEQVLRLPPAHYLKIQNQQLSFSRYWDPLPPGFNWATEAEENSFPDLLRQAVSRCLSVGADSILLSGGFDSPSIAVMATLITTQNLLPVIHAISAPETTFGAANGELQMAIAQALNMPQTLFQMNEILPEETIIQASLEMSHISPLPNLNPFESSFIGLMELARSDGLSTAMSGEGGDELLYVDRVWADDLFASGQITRAIKLHGMLDHYYNYSIKERFHLNYQRLGHQIKKALRRSWAGRNISFINNFSKRQLYKLPSWISHKDKTFVETLEHRLNHSRNSESDKDASNYIRSRREMLQDSYNSLFLEHKYFYTRSIGFTNLYPYFDMDLMELVYRIRPESLVKDNLVKAPLQQFLRRNMPEIAFPDKKADFNPVIHRILRSQGNAAWNNLDQGKTLENLGIIENTNLDNYMQQYFQNQSQSWTTIWMALSIESWLNSWHSGCEEEKHENH